MFLQVYNLTEWHLISRVTNLLDVTNADNQFCFFEDNANLICASIVLNTTNVQSQEIDMTLLIMMKGITKTHPSAVSILKTSV